MANEIQVRAAAGITAYAQIRNTIGQIWSTTGSAFEAYQTSNIANYSISLTQQGTASTIYAGNFPTAIAAGLYYIVAWKQVGGSVAETDTYLGRENFNWDGTVAMPLANVATSGQLGSAIPVRVARSWMVTNFPFYLRSSADHVTPFTSGVCSGQILRDGGTWGPLNSGAFTEKGNGFYTVQALTSGDLAANAVSLVFTANGVSGGASDPAPFVFMLQRVSGQ